MTGFEWYIVIGLVWGVIATFMQRVMYPASTLASYSMAFIANFAVWWIGVPFALYRIFRS